MSVIFSPAIPGPEMAASFLWVPGILWFFLLETPIPIKFRVLGGGVVFFLDGGEGCQFYFYGLGRCERVLRFMGREVQGR